MGSIHRFLPLRRQRVHPQLGSLRRSRGTWCGSLVLGDTNTVPLFLAGDANAPDPRHAMLAVELRGRWKEIESEVNRMAALGSTSNSRAILASVEVVATHGDDAVNLSFHDTASVVTLRDWAIVNAPTPKTTADVFEEILDRNEWLSAESRSGVGSERAHTALVVAALPDIFSDLGITSMLDLPCGDFNWMQDVDLAGVDYVGADIVERLVADNTERFGRPGVRFERLDVVRDALPRSDLVLCRDCLVHLRSDEVFMALANIVASGSDYLLTTTFPERSENIDIPTGQWRPLNLERQPYSLPPPMLVINEGFMEDQGRWADKSLALWSVEEIGHRLEGLHI